MRKLINAIFIALAAVFLVTFSITYVDSLRSDVWGIEMALLTGGVATLVALIVMISWALPIHFLLKKYNLTSLTWYVLAGIAPAFIFVYAFKPFGEDTAIDLLQQALFCSLVGAISAFCFWYFIAKKSLTNCSN